MRIKNMGKKKMRNKKIRNKMKMRKKKMGVSRFENNYTEVKHHQLSNLGAEE